MPLEVEERGVNMMNLIEKDMSLFCIAAMLDMKQEHCISNQRTFRYRIHQSR